MINKMNLLASFLIVLSIYNTFYSQSDDLLKYGIPYRKGDKWGYMDYRTKEMMIKPIYDSISHFHSRNFICFFKKNKVGVLFCGKINEKDSLKGEVIPANFDRIYKSDNWYTVVNGKMHGCFDLEGKLLLPTNYHYITSIEPIKHQKPRLIVATGFTKFSSGIFDSKTKKFITDTIYDIDNTDSYTIKELEKSLNKKIYNIILKNKENEIYILDEDFNLIKRQDIFIEPPLYEGVFSVTDPNPDIYKQKLYTLLTDKTIYTSSKKKYKSFSKVKYYKTNKVIGNYGVIKSKKGYGLISISNPDYKNPDLEPVYSNISYINHNKKEVFIISNENEKKGVFVSKEFIIQPEYDDVLQAQKFIELNNDKGKDFIFFNQEQIKCLDLKAKNINRSGRISFNMSIYIVTTNQNLYYYIDETGFKYYEE